MNAVQHKSEPWSNELVRLAWGFSLGVIAFDLCLLFASLVHA